MTTKDMEQRNKVDISSNIMKLKQDLLNLNFQKKAGEISDISKFKIIRKEIARLTAEIKSSSRMQGFENA